MRPRLKPPPSGAGTHSVGPMAALCVEGGTSFHTCNVFRRLTSGRCRVKKAEKERLKGLEGAEEEEGKKEKKEKK